MEIQFLFSTPSGWEHLEERECSDMLEVQMICRMYSEMYDSDILAVPRKFGQFTAFESKAFKNVTENWRDDGF